MRFPIEIFDAVRKAWPENKPLGVRVSATDWASGGWDTAENLKFCETLMAHGCDYICVSSGGTTPDQKITVGPLYQVPFAAEIKEMLDAVTMAVGLIRSPQEAQQVVSSGQADFCALARGMLSNPKWAWDAANEFGEKVFYPRQYDRARPSMRNNDSFTVRNYREHSESK